MPLWKTPSGAGLSNTSTKCSATTEEDQSLALLTGVFASKALGGIGYAEGVGMAAQVGTQALAVR